MPDALRPILLKLRASRPIVIVAVASQDEISRPGVCGGAIARRHGILANRTRRHVDNRKSFMAGAFEFANPAARPA